METAWGKGAWGEGTGGGGEMKRAKGRTPGDRRRLGFGWRAHTPVYTDDVLQNCTHETYVVWSTKFTPSDVIKHVFKSKARWRKDVFRASSRHKKNIQSTQYTCRSWSARKKENNLIKKFTKDSKRKITKNKCCRVQHRKCAQPH